MVVKMNKLREDLKKLTLRKFNADIFLEMQKEKQSWQKLKIIMMKARQIGVGCRWIR
jgi:hypothetical protein